MDTHAILPRRSRWDKAAARLGLAERCEFQFLAAIAATDAAGDGRLAERLAALTRKDSTRRQAAAAGF